MTLLQAIIIAIIQGATELFPVSSLGHAAIVPALLHWSIDLHGDMFLPFLVMLHLGTVMALLLFFWGDWRALLSGASGRDGMQRQMESIRILVLLCVATVPAVIVGGLFEHMIRNLFGTARYAAIFLTLNGAMLLLTERIKGRGTQSVLSRPIASLGLGEAVMIGMFQCLAFLPGISRSGACIVGGLLSRLSHENAARFAFLMAPLVILMATGKEIFELRHVELAPGQLEIAGIGAVVAALVALVSTAVLMRYFHDHEKWALQPFGYYCIAMGVFSFIYLG
ncbi:undecaprenyl-diphosphate phosphatase [Novacetimonas pomaceti]|uniref:Undecaprenyl-diphosphatase n=1 Tax=Novacetimonas pomaceti TaxID=2021998 RepID=A0A318QB83_9PROT|nr:undecaprenyl-diphosphate phosphatase [Novacetimonas pomaceti]MBV1834071.1 undecaprenyl-diphosphate phosphatase [Novacetimonas pomaceti]PYD75860.1 undecaprenyl-diphosphatase [Novacetimonas pomaceti]